MSAPASASKQPAVVRSHSTSSRPPRPATSDLPHRTRSVAVRPSNTSQPPQQTHAKTPSHDRRPPSNPAALDSVARRDFEASNIARRREPSSERSQERPTTATRTESTRRHQRNPSSQGRPRDSVDMSGPPAADRTDSSKHATAAHGTPAASTQPRRRTTITTPTGQWALGKTIGAGSMGKVKLAKNMETGEQVLSSV